ncbi:MAG: PAS domain-containing sensor histidine kinase [Desulfovibrio sp.]
MEEQSIPVGAPEHKERKRRRRELAIALTCFALIGLLTWVQLKYLAVDSYLFLGLFNVNFILLLLVLFIVTRNAVKLLLERRRKVLGSRLRTRLVVAFVSLSLIPTLLMFMVSVKFVQTSVDYWFKVQVEDSMEHSLNLSETFYRVMEERLEQQAATFEGMLREKSFRWGGKSMEEFCQEKGKEWGVSILGVVQPDDSWLTVYRNNRIARAWPSVEGQIALQHRDHPESSFLLKGGGVDHVIAFRAVDKGESGYIVIGDQLGWDVHEKLRQVINGLNEYQKLKTLKSPWKTTLYMTLGVMTSLIILGAIWFGFRLAKELSAPIQALAAGTERVARGDLSVMLEDSSDDELGFLVKSFNGMTEDLRESRARLDTYNRRLSQQNRELERRGRYIEAVLDNITSGVVTMDHEGRVGTMNRAAEDMLGLVSREIIGRKPLMFLQGEFAEMLREAREQMVLDPQSQWQRQIDIQVRSKTAKFFVNVVSLRAKDGEAYGIVAVFEDITELEKVQRMAAWREVARRIAHEIKNPLTPIKLSAQRLQRRYGEEHQDKTFADCTELIVRQVERIQQMVTQFSAYAKMPEVQPRTDALPPLLEEVVGMFANTYRNVRWNLEMEPELPRFSFDREALRRVFINLLTNAAEALNSRENGLVEVLARHDQERGKIVLVVQDNGPGLSKEEASRLFEPYFSRKKGGTGLGLTIVRTVVGDHRGVVHAASRPEGGARFTVELPEH